MNRIFKGIFFILPCIDAYARVDLRTRTYDVPPQEVSTFRVGRSIKDAFELSAHKRQVFFESVLVELCHYFTLCSQVLTKDSVTVSVDAVVYYRVSNATVSIANVENAHHSTRLLAQTTLRNTMGTRQLHEILSERMTISGSMQVCKLLLKAFWSFFWKNFSYFCYLSFDIAYTQTKFIWQPLKVLLYVYLTS